jgi:hypothetical protein
VQAKNNNLTNNKIFKMKKLTTILIIILSINCYSQNESFTVKETTFRIGDTGEFKSLGSNDIFTKFIFKKDYVELHTSQKEYTTIMYNEMEKVRKKNGKYENYFYLKDWLVSLIFAPYPYADSEPVFIGALVVMPGVDKNRPKTLTTFQMTLDYY